MFQSAYQDGDCVEVFSPAGKNPAAKWKLSGKVVRLYEKGVKGYVLAVSGGATSKMQLPKAPKGQLGLRQRHLVLQVLTAVSQDKPFSLELGLTDTAGTRRRLVLSSSFRALHCTPLHAQIPLDGLERHRGTWANLSIDLAGLTAMCFRADAFRTLDYIAINPTCRLRKIFTMKGALNDEALEETAEGTGQHRRVAAALSGLNGASAVAPLAPVPLRVAFPAGVVPAPQDWIISVPTLQRLASRNGPPPSPSPGGPLAATDTKKGVKARQTPSPRQSQLTRGPAFSSPIAATMRISAEGRGMLSSGGGAAEGVGTPSPRLREQVARNPLHHSSSRTSPGGVLSRRPSLSSRGSSVSSTRLPATPSPLATPLRTGITATRRRDPPTPCSASSSTLEASTPDRVNLSVGVAVGPFGRRGVATTSAIVGSPAPLPRDGASDISCFRRPSSDAAVAGKAETPGSATCGVVATVGRGNCDELGGTEGRGVLPARRRASAAYYAADRIRDMGGQTSSAENGSDSGVRCGPGGGITGASEEEWREAGQWKGGLKKPAPAWSFLDESLTEGTSEMVASLPKRSFSAGSPSALCAEVVSPSLQPSSETLADEDYVSWRETRHGDGAIAARKRFTAASSLRSPEGNSACIASPRSHPSPSSPTVMTTAGAASNPTALGTPKQSFSDPAVVGRKEGGKAINESTKSTHASTSPFPLPGGESSTARHSPVISAGDSKSSDGGTMLRSPMSARFDVLQGLVAPAVMGDKTPRQKHERLVQPAQVQSTESEVGVERTDRRGGGDKRSDIECSENVVEIDALECLLVHSAITSDPRSSSICGDHGKRNTTGVRSIVNDVAKRARDRPSCRLNSRSNVMKIGDGSDRFRTTDTEANASKLIRAEPLPSCVQSDAESVDLTHKSGGQTGPVSDDNGRVTVRGTGAGVGEEGGIRLCAREDTEDFLQLPSFLERNENEWLDVEVEASGKVDRSELDELRRKEVALVDLEESFRTEFGSVDFSRSPGVGLVPEQLCQPTISPIEKHIAADALTKQQSLRRRRDRGEPSGKTVCSSGPQKFPRNTSACDHDRNEDGDVDSVVLGSRDSAASPALKDDAAEGTDEHGSLPVVQEEEGRQENTKSRRSGAEECAPLETKGTDSELYFDPVLNCYYDRVADKYYALR